MVALEADYDTVAAAALIAPPNLKAVTVLIGPLSDEKREEILTTNGACFYIELNGMK